MVAKFLQPVAGIIETNELPYTLKIIAILDSNLNTDARFKLNGQVIGIDTSATTVNIAGTPEYRYTLNYPIPTQGNQELVVEDFDAKLPDVVKSSASVNFELKYNAPTLAIAQVDNLVTATITNRPATGSFVRFTLNGNVLKEDNTSPINVAIAESGTLVAELIKAGNVLATVTSQVTFVPPVVPVPTMTLTQLNNLVTATITNRPTGAFVRFTQNGQVLKEDTTSPFNVTAQLGELKIDLVLGTQVLLSQVLTVISTTPTPTPTPIAGAKGDKGDQGLKGDKGDRGDVGATGLTGLQGIQGIKGDSGIQGNVGATGAKGDIGLTGLTGLQGILGPKGDSGIQGIKGDKGDQGITGPAGATGSVGMTGLSWRGTWNGTTTYSVRDAIFHNGSSYVAIAASTNSPPPSANWNLLAQQGATGATGPQGAIGVQGIQGATGTTGAQGIQGLKGDRGDVGATGATGAVGVIGATGATGAVGATGATGLVWRGTWNGTTAYSVRDAIFHNGSSYVAIAPSTNSVPPSANWNLLAQQGATGATGATGAIGSVGATGATGAIGPVGATGAQGAAGPTGIVWSAFINIPLAAGVTGGIAYQTCGKLIRLVVSATVTFSNISGLTLCILPAIFSRKFYTLTDIMQENGTMSPAGVFAYLRHNGGEKRLILQFPQSVSGVVVAQTEHIIGMD